MNDTEMKENILFVIFILVGLGIGYYIGEKVTNDKWQLKIANAPTKRTTTIIADTIKSPREEKKIYIPPKPTPQRRTTYSSFYADSVFKAGIAKGIDSATALFHYVTAPVDTMIVFATQDTMLLYYAPLNRMLTIDFIPAPKIERTIHIVDSVYVAMPSQQPWYDRWYIGALGSALVLFGLAQI